MNATYQACAIAAKPCGYVGLVRRYVVACGDVMVIDGERVADGYTTRRSARQWARRAARQWQDEESFA